MVLYFKNLHVDLNDVVKLVQLITAETTVRPIRQTLAFAKAQAQKAFGAPAYAGAYAFAA